MRSWTARITLALFVGLLLVPGALAQDAGQQQENPTGDLPVLGDLGGDGPALPAQPDLPGQTAADDDGATTTRTPAQATEGDGDILPVTGAPAAVLAFSGAALLATGSALLLARRVRLARGAVSEVLREVLWSAG